MNPKEKIELFKSKCISAFGRRLECLVLTGSYSTGDYTPSSDIDLWVFIKDISLKDIQRVGDIVSEIGQSPEINPQCTSLAELENSAFKVQFNPVQLYIDSVVLHGSLPGLGPSPHEIKDYASSAAAFGLMSARHYIAAQESEEGLGNGKLQRWVLKPLMWALRYRVLSETSFYPRRLEELSEILSNDEEKELVRIYLLILSDKYKGPFMPVVKMAERVAKEFICS